MSMFRKNGQPRNRREKKVAYWARREQRESLEAAYKRGREDAANRVWQYMRDTYGGSITVEEDKIIALIRGDGEQA